MFVFAPAQRNWVCFTWKSALEICSLLLLLLLLLLLCPVRCYWNASSITFTEFSYTHFTVSFYSSGIVRGVFFSVLGYCLMEVTQFVILEKLNLFCVFFLWDYPLFFKFHHFSPPCTSSHLFWASNNGSHEFMEVFSLWCVCDMTTSVCVYVCVWERERETDRQTEHRERERERGV